MFADRLVVSGKVLPAIAGTHPEEITMTNQMPTPPPQQELSSDLLRGADKIAEFLFGDARDRRKVYHLAETSRLPVFRLGAVLCARRSVLLEWIRRQEDRGWCCERCATSLNPASATSTAAADEKS